MAWLNDLPGKTKLIELDMSPEGDIIPKVNNHIHTPYSFSAFKSVGEAVALAANEHIRILGINDFYVTDGYSEFIDECIGQNVFPLLNIELIGINRDWQRQGLRVNDPGNPGRTYISGKGLKYPVEISAELHNKLSGVIRESHNQVSEMIVLLNSWLARQDVNITLSMDEIFEKYAQKLVRERHIVKALRLKLEEIVDGDGMFLKILEKIYGNKKSGKDRNDMAGLEEELRARLLKAGAPAFVPEDEKAFLPLDDIIKIIRAYGGIPTYPMLLDGTGGAITEFESEKERLFNYLSELEISAIEFIPSRNSFEILREYVTWFYNRGFSVSFGTEHNTTAMTPLTVSCKNGVPLDEELMEISYNGAAYIAAHQYLVAKEGMDYGRESRKNMEKLGKAVIGHFKSKK